MKHQRRVVDIVTTILEPGDPEYRIPNPFHPRFYLVPSSVMVTFNSTDTDPETSVRAVTVAGQRYRIMAHGPDKPVGPHQNRPDTHPSEFHFPTAASIPAALWPLIRAVNDEGRYGIRAEV